MSTLSTHVLDTSRGGPAVSVMIELLVCHEDGTRTSLAQGDTNADGRLQGCLPEHLRPGVYAMRFAVEDYFAKQGIQTFYPYAEVVFHLRGDEHYHVPLLLSPFGYSTYRGS